MPWFPVTRTKALDSVLIARPPSSGGGTVAVEHEVAPIAQARYPCSSRYVPPAGNKTVEPLGTPSTNRWRAVETFFAPELSIEAGTYTLGGSVAVGVGLGVMTGLTTGARVGLLRAQAHPPWSRARTRATTPATTNMVTDALTGASPRCCEWDRPVMLRIQVLTSRKRDRLDGRRPLEGIPSSDAGTTIAATSGPPYWARDRNQLGCTEKSSRGLERPPTATRVGRAHRTCV